MVTRRRRSARLLGLVAAAAASTLVAFAPIGTAGAETTTALSVRGIDGTDKKAVEVTFMWTGDATKISGATLRENGVVTKIQKITPLSKTDQRLATVFVVDLSGSMSDDGVLSNVKKGLESYAEAMTDGDRMALVSYSNEPVVESAFTADHGQLSAAIDGMAAPRDGKTATYDGIRKAVALVNGQSGLQPNIVLVTDGVDDVSTSTKAAAKASVAGSGAGFFGVALGHNGDVDRATMDDLATRTGGATVEAPKAGNIAKAFQDLTSTIKQQYVATYASNADQGQVDVSLSIGGEEVDASYVAGSTANGGATIHTVAAPKAFGPAFLHTKVGGMLGLALVGVAVGLGAFAIVSLAGSTDQSLNAVLRPYSDGPVAAEGEDNEGALAQTAILQRAVELTEEFAERQGFLVKVERALERADLPLRAAEALFFWLAGAATLSIGMFFLGGFMPGLFMGLITGLLPPTVVKFKAGRRQKAFQSALPDTLQLLSGSLRAGYSLLQGVEAVSKEVGDPMGKELRRVITEARLGREIEDAMEQVAERMGSADFAWAVMAVRIQREVGGNLSELLLTVSDTMVQRERLRRDVAALTAEGKISAMILAFLPIGLGAFMWMGNPQYMAPLGSTTLGHVLLGLATFSGLIGFAWMKKIINITI